MRLLASILLFCSGSSLANEVTFVTKEDSSICSSNDNGYPSSRVEGNDLNERVAPAQVKVPRIEEGSLEDSVFKSFDDWKREKLLELKQEYQERIPHENSFAFKGSNANNEEIRDAFDIDFEIFNEEEPEGKVYKDKMNYASLDCAATIIKTNSEAQGASSVLLENKDKSLLNPCSASNQFVTIELCEDILIESIVMANLEFFSSTFRRVRFSVSERFPVPKNGWKIIGEFEAENTRTIQTFKINNPIIWARYLRIEVLSHYGEEFYCPITLVRAHGVAMIDEFKMEIQSEDEGSEIMRRANELNQVQQEKCQIPQSFATNNMSFFLDQKQYSQCIAPLTLIDFEEFFQDHRGNENITKITDSTSSLPLNTEESIFKNIMKRLAGLEMNTTMSVMYIEEQSKLLSKSFGKLEDSYAEKFDSLISVFNDSIHTNLGTLNKFAHELRDTSLNIIEEQKLENRKFMTSTLNELERLKSDSLYQTRLTYLILFGLITLLLYVLLSREVYVEEHLNDDGWYVETPSLVKVKNTLRRTVSGMNEGLSFETRHPSISSFSSSSEPDDLYDDDSVIIPKS